MKLSERFLEAKTVRFGITNDIAVADAIIYGKIIKLETWLDSGDDLLYHKADIELSEIVKKHNLES